MENIVICTFEVCPFRSLNNSETTASYFIHPWANSTDPPVRRRRGGRNAQLTVDAVSGQASDERGACSFSRFFVRERVTGRRRRAVVGCRPRRRRAKALPSLGWLPYYDYTHVHARGANDWLAACVSSAFPFPEIRTGVRSFCWRARARVYELQIRMRACTHADIRYHVAVRPFARRRSGSGAFANVSMIVAVVDSSWYSREEKEISTSSGEHEAASKRARSERDDEGDKRGGSEREREENSWREREKPRARPIVAFPGSVVDETVVARRNLSHLRGNTPARRRE